MLFKTIRYVCHTVFPIAPSASENVKTSSSERQILLSNWTYLSEKEKERADGTSFIRNGKQIRYFNLDFLYGVHTHSITCKFCARIWFH